MTKTQTRTEKARIKYFIQLVPFEDGQLEIGGRRFASKVIIPEMKTGKTVDMDSAVGEEMRYAEGMYYRRKSEAPRCVDIVRYSDGRLEIDVRERTIE